MSRYEHIGNRVDQHVIPVFRRQRGLLPVTGCQKPSLQHLLHRLYRGLIAQSPYRAQYVVHAPAVIGQEEPPFQLDIDGVSGENDILREHLPYALRQCGLRFCGPHGVVVPRLHYYAYVVGDLLYELRQMSVLLVDVGNLQLLLLIRVYADSIHQISGHDDVLH